MGGREGSVQYSTVKFEQEQRFPAAAALAEDEKWDDSREFGESILGLMIELEWFVVVF